MGVRIDEPRHDKAAGRVDDALARRIDGGRDGANYAVFSKQIGALMGKGRREEAEAAEEVKRRLAREGLERGTDEVRGLAVVVRRPGPGVGEVAAAVAGGHELAAHAGLPLVERHLVSQPHSGERRRHAGGARAYDRGSHCS